MRIWEFEDNKAMPSDLVREQDFILRVRRLQRLGTPHIVINLVLTALEAVGKSRRALEAVQERLQEFAKVSKGDYAEMSNGDVFITWSENPDAQALAERIVAAILPEGEVVQDHSQFMLTYTMPRDYTPLRERANHYVEVVRAAATMGHQNPAEILKSANVHGPLTAWSVDQIGRLLTDIDLRRYGRTQPVYQHQADGNWKALFEEYFISFEDLRRERFPKLEIITPEHLFLALCETIDQRLLATLSENYDSIAGKPIQLNLSVGSILGSVFARFARSVPRDKRDLVGFELHRGDLLQDFALTLSAIGTLKQEGFKVAIDSVTPDMVNYLNLSAFDVDYIKINVSKDRTSQLFDPAIRKGLEKIPPEKIIFFRCDNEKALAVGLEFGVKKFQGWLIDDVAHKKE